MLEATTRCGTAFNARRTSSDNVKGFMGDGSEGFRWSSCPISCPRSFLDSAAKTF